MASDRFPSTTWERVEPEDAGWSGQKLEKAQIWSRQIGSIAVAVAHRGAVVAEWGDTTAKTKLASVRKSLLSALIGNAVERKEIDLSQTIESLGIDDNEPSLTRGGKDPQRCATSCRPGRASITRPSMRRKPRQPRARRATATSPAPSGTTTIGISTRSARSMSAPCGRRSSTPSSARLPGQSACRTISRATVEYVTGAASVYPAYPIKMSARDLARFALLYLHKGRWQDRQIIPVAWVEESTRPYSHAEWGPGYGYLWWTGPIGNVLAPSVNLPDGTFFAAGTGGQYALCHSGLRFGCRPPCPTSRRRGGPQDCRPTSLAHSRRRQVSGHWTRCVA